ncbi:MAG: SOS response-associated peptidase, partial [Gemmatimonadales bacterium]
DREVFKLLEVPRLEPRYNVAPTQEVPVVREEPDGSRRVVIMRWGLIPHWAKDPAIGNRMINARSETLPHKPAFKEPFQHRRCLVPADGFYEWQKTPHGKVPQFLRVDDGEIFAFAALWERWRGPETGPVETFTILTTQPNDLVRPIHNRMPVILEPDHYDLWLDPAQSDTHELSGVLRPYPAERMSAYPVSRYVNDPRNEGPECIAPSPP